MLSLLLSSGVNIEHVNNKQRQGQDTALICACKEQKIACAVLMVEAGAEVIVF